MPVRDLAPALLAVGDLFAEASRVLHPDLPPVALDIQATEDGSFTVNLILYAPDLWDQIVEIFTSKDVTAIINLRDALLAGGGLFWLQKHLRARRVEKKERVEPGHIRLTLDDGSTVEGVPEDVWRLYERATIRKKTRDVVKPLARKGVQRLDFRAEGEVTVSVESRELDAFDVEEGEPVEVSDTETPKALQVLTAQFTEGNRWRFTDGEAIFTAAMEDGEFLDRVTHGGEAFRAGDILRCLIREVQTESEGKLSIDRQIVKVVEHVPSGPQLGLAPGDDDPGPEAP